MSASYLARRVETVVTYVVTGASDCYADLACSDERLGPVFLQELAGTPGIVDYTLYPVLRYFRTLGEWQPEILSDQQIDALRDDGPPQEWPSTVAPYPLNHVEDAVLRGLAENGRRSAEELARAAGVSVQTVRRRIAALQAAGILSIRAVLEPALLGFPIGALIWLKVKPGNIDTVVSSLQASPYVRYGAIVLGSENVVVDVRVPDRRTLYDFLNASDWAPLAEAAEASMILSALKQSDILLDQGPPVSWATPDRSLR
ncbi:Lrp/AsnC family transcriptional regulator [Nocardioides caldifontis]|uniref:Lrp/AsnC family transcriptional regulator n=1 Tax=Nocardioides caldifontis TaxID=2588938 RepID=UPI001EEFDA35|nr:AsnC family transcriptional regulator [Nocardioides caldifontis]